MQRLLALLDAEVIALEALVQCTQREQQHILAFEPEALVEVVKEKQALLEKEGLLRVEREDAVTRHLERLGMSCDSPTLGALVEGLPLGLAAPLAIRRDRLRALLGALRELNEVAAMNAGRQLRWIRQRRSALTGSEEQYGPDGRSRMRGQSNGRMSGWL